MGKPRMTRRDTWKQRPCVVAYRLWCDQLREAVGEVPPAEEVMSVSWKAVFQTPRSWSKKKAAAAVGTLHRSTPDRDNIDKAILDALWKRDQAIAAGSLLKVWGVSNLLEIRIET